jgi:hypothetical protein
MPRFMPGGSATPVDDFTESRTRFRAQGIGPRLAVPGNCRLC